MHLIKKQNSSILHMNRKLKKKMQNKNSSCKNFHLFMLRLEVHYAGIHKWRLQLQTTQWGKRTMFRSNIT